MSEDEIIKGITNIIYTCNEIIEDTDWYNEEEIKSAEEQSKLTQGLLDLYKQEKEKNKELEIRLQEEINEVCKLKTELYGNSISKDKIREKIEEFCEKDKNPMTVDMYHYYYQFCTRVLKEILEED